MPFWLEVVPTETQQEEFFRWKNWMTVIVQRETEILEKDTNKQTRCFLCGAVLAGFYSWTAANFCGDSFERSPFAASNHSKMAFHGMGHRTHRSSRKVCSDSVWRAISRFERPNFVLSFVKSCANRLLRDKRVNFLFLFGFCSSSFLLFIWTP